MLLEHLGTGEVRRMIASPSTTTIEILRFVIPGLLIGLTAVGSLCAGLTIQTIDLDSTYLSLISSLLLLSFFYSLYEGYRLAALWQLRGMDASVVQAGAKLLLDKLDNYSGLEGVMQRNGIDQSSLTKPREHEGVQDDHMSRMDCPR